MHPPGYETKKDKERLKLAAKERKITPSMNLELRHLAVGRRS